MTVLGDSIKRWCQEESVSVAAQQDDETALDYAVTLSGDPPVSISLRASAERPGRVVLSHTAHMSLPEEAAREPEAQQRLATLLERVATSRSALVECRLIQWKGELTADIVATLHEEGLTKQSFLVALEEVKKVTRVIAWELEAMALTEGLVSEVRSRVGSIVERAEALASEAAKAAEDLQAPPAPVEAPPPQEAPPPAAEPSPAPPPPAPATEGPAAPAPRFCPSCGKETKPGQRFCIGCGTSLEAQA